MAWRSDILLLAKQKSLRGYFMKMLYLIGGPMGVGKSTVCRRLKEELPNSVFLDGDWCWDASPFQVTEETKRMVLDNICHLLNNFIRCTAYENIIFCWVMHEQSIIDNIVERLAMDSCIVKAISLICEEESLRERLTKDIEKGIRTPDVVERSLVRIPLYEGLKTIKIDTTGKSVNLVAREIVGRTEE